MKINPRFWIFPLALAGVHTIVVIIVLLAIFAAEVNPNLGWLYSIASSVGNVLEAINGPAKTLARALVGQYNSITSLCSVIVLSAIYWFLIGVVLSLPVAIYLSRKKSKESP